ncbi:efflux RND transporter periplasmic adaptor subunit [Thalassomonas sp. RHCl1]|uniref:efflux RND transporter periplasmic adaptor subunit n=1 Tax=Thalassomonas sp. RHCl1 TaxID=2995320 RepID=UPI00248B85F6|nr:efflux RND transporter periplasmic adaptor subunit [Thalassomonas sp. RHCl1]
MRAFLISILLFNLAVMTSVFSLPARAEITQVDVVYPKTNQSHQILQLTGTVEARQNAELSTQQSGLVAALYVEAGDKVAKGDKLLTLDDTLARLSLAEAKASVEAGRVAQAEAERLYKEVLALSKQKVVAETLIGERKAGVASAKAELAMRKASLALQQEVVNRHSLYAPFAGVIASRNADLGEWVSQQTRVFNLVQQQELRLNLAIPQEYYGQLIDREKVAVTVTPDFADAAAIEAHLSRLVAVANNQSRTLTAHVDLPASANLVAGMSAEAEIKLPQSKENLVWLPKSAIKQHPDGGASIFAVVDNKAKRFLVKVVRQQGEKVAVSGAPANQALVRSGIELMREGHELKINSVQGQPL